MHLKGKIYLFDESLFQWLIADWDFHGWWKDWGDIAQKEEEIDISFNIFIYIWMPNFDCNLFTSVLCFVNLTYWSWSDWLWIKFFKNILDIFIIWFSKILLCDLELMCWSFFPKIFEFRSQLLSNNIPPMTQILKSLDKYNSSTFNGLHKDVHPIAICSFKEQ